MYPDILSDLIITRFGSATTIYTEKNKGSQRNNRLCWAMIIKYEGETVYYSNGRSYLSNANNMVILPKGSSYKWHCTEAGHFSVIEFESEAVCEEIFSIPVSNSEKILKMFKDMEYKRAFKPMHQAECIRDTYSVLLAIVQTMHKRYYPSGKRDKISPALDYIAKNYNSDIKNDNLAELTGLSTVYFRKLFTEVTGVSPMAYVHRLRIKKAKEMLKSDYGSITDIAQSLGYLNIYDFSRAFKKHVGVSPSKYE